MKKCHWVVSGIVLLAVILATPVFAAEGGIGPMLGSCCLGPRIGLEMNEGKEIEMLEFGRIVPSVGEIIHLYVAYDYGYKTAGNKGFLASCCIGPRVGQQFDKRKIREIEKLLPIPIVQLYPWVMIGLEAYAGKTMTEIASEENLAR